MNREPKISEIEKLLNHFRNNGREDELNEVLNKHQIVSSANTHNGDHQEVKGNEGAGLSEYEERLFGGITDFFREKWYARYAVYYTGLFIFILLILNGPVFINQVRPADEAKAKILTVQDIETYEMEKSAPLDPGEVVPAGSQIIIPKINVTAPIVYTTSNDEKVIQENLTKGVVHYKGTAEPGTVGNSFITGHSSNFWWIKGNYNYVFVNLNKLVVGDQAKIYHNGNKYVYQVKEIKVVEPTDTSVLTPTDTPTLTLMTCTPTGTNWKRLIVSFDQVSPRYIKPKVVTKQILAKPDLLPSTDTNSVGGVLSSIGDAIKNIFGL